MSKHPPHGGCLVGYDSPTTDETESQTTLINEVLPMNKATIVKDVTINYPKLVTPVNPFGKDIFDLQIEVPAERMEEFKALDLKIREENGKTVANVTRNAKNAKGDATPVMVVDANLKPMDAKLIGNGSTANLKLYTYAWTNNGRSGIKTIMTAIQVTKLVEYVADMDFTAVE